MAGAPTPNFANRTMWTRDNLDILRGLNSESIDLIYADPPFNSNKTYAAPVGSKAAGAAFKDTWTLSDIDLAWHGEIADREPKVYAAIDNAGIVHGPSMKSYLIMMAVRLLELRRVLKPTGSLYLHCDDTADSYLRMLCDAVFGRPQFRNAIIWKRSARSDGRRFGRTHDTLLAYGSKSAVWNDVRVPYSPDYLARFYREQDSRGQYQRVDLSGPRTTDGESGRPWRGHDPTASGRCWSVPRTGAYAKWIQKNLIPGYMAIQGVHARLDALDEANLIHWPKRGSGWPRLKRYADASEGQRICDVFDDIRPVSNLGKEQVGYPTQKPLALLDRIIKASSNPGDAVLDPFCGCATACVSAESLGRQWIGIDLSPVAAQLVESRLRDQFGIFAEVHHRTDIPRRTDLGELPNYRIAVDRWRRSKRASASLEDAYIDLRVALESLYLKDFLNEHSQEMRFRLALFGAWHLATDLDDRRSIRKSLRDAYDTASGAVHAGEVADEARASLSGAQDLCRHAILKLLLEGPPRDWGDLILGA